MSEVYAYQEEKKKIQNELKNTLALENTGLAGKDVTEDEVEKEICRRLQDGINDEYLVNGAILGCTSATWEDFPLSDGKFIKIDGKDEKQNKGEPTEYLRVLENPMYTNELRHANVTDTRQGWNILPFPCNCMEKATYDQEEILKTNKVDCQSHGVCKYLMDLEDAWENIDFKTPYAEFPDGKMYSWLEEAQAVSTLDRIPLYKKTGITMTSVLFCRHGGFIYPITSGQTILFNEWEAFAKENYFTARQCMALFEIMNYFESNPELCQGTAIFVFEGLATPVPLRDENVEDKDDPSYEWNWNGTNKYHPNGQFGAIIIVTVDGKPDCVAMKASTLPDNMEKAAIICEGVYTASETAHSKSKDGGYAALTLMYDDDIPAYNSKTGNDHANYIHFHMAGLLKSDNPANPCSEGCITMPVRQYAAFGKDVGFINEGTDEKIGEDNDYSVARVDLKASSHSKEFKGYMIIDRQYYDDTGNDEVDRYLKFNGPRGQE